MDKAPSDKQLLRKACAVKTIASAFLDAYENHIRTTYNGSTEALDKYRAGKLSAPEALTFVQGVVSEHLLQCNIMRAEESIKKQQRRPPPKTNVCGTGKYECIFTIKVTDERTREFEEVVFKDHNGYDTWKVNTFQEAMRLVDRKQTEMPDALYAIISQEIAPGRHLKTQVMRGDSIARVLRMPKGPVSKSKPTSAEHKNYMHCKNDTCSFSGG